MGILNRIPVRPRLALAHAIWMAGLFLVIGFSVFKIVENDVNHSVDAALLSSAQAVKEAHISWTQDVLQNEDSLGALFQNPFHTIHSSGEEEHLLVDPFFQVVHVSGRVYLKSDNTFVTLPLTPQAIATAEEGSYYFETFVFKDRAPLRQITLPITQSGLFTGDLIQVATSLRPTLDTLRGTGLLLMLTLCFVLLVSVILGYALTSQALTPVRNISQAASKLGIADLSIRLPLSTANDELRELSQTFNAMLDHLEDAVKRLRRFTSDVSHELRTPLAVIRGESEFALKKERSPEEYRRALQVISKESLHMSGIVEDLLFLAKAESKALTQNWAPVNAAEFVAGLKESLAATFRNQNVTLVEHIDDPSTTFTCSKGHLALAFKNILLNAAKHSPAHSNVYFDVRKQTGDKLLFTIRDEGEGIAPQDLPYIFDPFFRADSARNRAMGGIGIGLSLTQAMIKMHRGEVKVTSELGKGTQFCTSIPVDAPYS